MKEASPDTAARTPVNVLLKSQIYRDYQRAFTEATSLPLDLHEPQMARLVHFAKDQENLFCALMAKSNKACEACYEIQKELEQQARVDPKTLRCFAGLCESAVPVRLGENVIAFLHTGHVLLHGPSHSKFNRVAATLMKWGAEIDLKQLEEAYFQTRVLSPKQYEAFIRLLAIFAEHLAACSTQLLMRSTEAEPKSMIAARAYIAEHHTEGLSLQHVAKAVNLSANYFSELFKKTTGMTFIDYVTRMRVEKSRNLLRNPGRQISQIAFDVGFQSLSQFNRAFKKITGQSPTEVRTQLTADL